VHLHRTEARDAQSAQVERKDLGGPVGLIGRCHIQGVGLIGRV
jgi:hypothetical protein